MFEMSEEERTMRDEVFSEVFEGKEPEIIEEEVVEEKPEDPWTGVNPALRQTLESLQSRMGGSGYNP